MTRRENVKVGFIGGGGALGAYLQMLDRLVPRGLASEGPICVRNREKWAALKERRPGITLVDTPQAVVSSDVDLVVILTPPASHAELTRLALEHGKHVVCEKPLARTSVEARSVVDLAHAQHRLLMAAPFVQLAPTFRLLWTLLRRGSIGEIHSARALYGNAGSNWAAWYHNGGIGPLAEAGIYNLKSLTAVLGPVVQVTAAEGLSKVERIVGGQVISQPDADVSHLILLHREGALSSLVSSHAIQRYRRPALEFYGTNGTANLLGDDWDPSAIELWTNESAKWSQFDAIDPTWLWADGLREAMAAIAEARSPLAGLDHDLHLLDIIEASKIASAELRTVEVSSRFEPYDLTLEAPRNLQLLHDHTRTPE